MATKRRFIEPTNKAQTVSSDTKTAPLIEHFKRLDTELPPDRRTPEEKEFLRQPLFVLHK